MERALALEEWAERVDPRDLKEADTSAIRSIAELPKEHQDVEDGDPIRSESYLNKTD